MAKRLFDVTLATVLLVLLSPVAVLAALAVRLESPGGVLYRGKRVGRDGEPFTVLKFRTMRTGESGTAVTGAGDRRVTRAGQVLRLSKLDEIPQLWNVLRGDMSLVGPRPEDPRYVAGYSAEQQELLRHRPGLTSPASVLFRNEEALLARLPGDLESAYREKVLPAKLAVDAEYFAHARLRDDAGVLLRTVVAIVRPPRLDEQLARLGL